MFVEFGYTLHVQVGLLCSSILYENGLIVNIVEFLVECLVREPARQLSQSRLVNLIVDIGIVITISAFRASSRDSPRGP